MRTESLAKISPAKNPPAPTLLATVPQSRISCKWIGAVLGLLASIGDTLSLKSLGTRFIIDGRDVTSLTAAWFGISFAILGFLLGAAIDARRRERSAAQLIRQQMETINQSRAQLAQHEKLAALGQLAAAIAHEVRNPLAVIRSAAQNLRDTVPAQNADASRACSFITDEADRLGALITALLAFARPAQISPTSVPVSELFERALSLAGESKSSKHVHVSGPVALEQSWVVADPELMSQVFVGLVANAIEAAPNGGDVTLEAVPGDREVELSVTDSGPGVPAELKDRVFEPFFTTRAEGVGLGLAIARQIVEAHGGRIEVGASKSGGARFAVILPRARSEAGPTA